MYIRTESTSLLLYILYAEILTYVWYSFRGIGAVDR